MKSKYMQVEQIERDNGFYYLKLKVKDDSKLGSFISRYCRNNDTVSDEICSELKANWNGNILEIQVISS